MLTKIFIGYASWFGNTEKVANEIGKAVDELEGTQVLVKKIKDVEVKDVLDYDVILLGSPNHMGGPTREIKKFIDNLGKLGIEGKKGAVFDTYVRKNVHIAKTVKKMEKRINEKIPGLNLIVDGLSILVKGVKGPLVEGELTKCVDFGKKIFNILN
jgi:flavodoxin